MSWWVGIVIDTGGEEMAQVEEVRNITYNDSKILTHLGIHPDQHDGHTCADWIESLRGAITRSLDVKEREEMKSMEPENKWGNLNDVQNFACLLLNACMKHPKAMVEWR